MLILVIVYYFNKQKICEFNDIVLRVNISVFNIVFVILCVSNNIKHFRHKIQKGNNCLNTFRGLMAFKNGTFHLFCKSRPLYSVYEQRSVLVLAKSAETKNNQRKFECVWLNIVDNIVDITTNFVVNVLFLRPPVKVLVDTSLLYNVLFLDRRAVRRRAVQQASKR